MSNGLPRWCGFNLPEMFVAPDDLRFAEMIRNPRGAFVEDEFKWIRDWGFNFVRLPLCYRWWASEAAPFHIDENSFLPIDRAVEWAQKLGIHLSVNLHHAPGYCINPAPRPDPFDLWKDETALDCFCYHWEWIASRYRGIPSEVLDFDLLNEPHYCTREQYYRVVHKAVTTIHGTSPDRLIMIDGYHAGTQPCLELSGLPVVQSCRGYLPSELTHFLAWWAGYSYVVPSWPQATTSDGMFGAEQLRESFAPWRELQEQGVRIFCGEFGCNNRTPHDITLRWMSDLLTVLREMNVGWAMWNFRGSFGILDSGRSDVTYEDFHGIPLDRKMLDLLQRM